MLLSVHLQFFFFISVHLGMWEIAATQDYLYHHISCRPQLAYGDSIVHLLYYDV